MQADDFQRRSKTMRIAATRLRIQLASLRRSLIDCDIRRFSIARAHQERVALAELADRNSSAAFGGWRASAAISRDAAKPQATRVIHYGLKLQFAGACQRLRKHAQSEAERLERAQTTTTEERSEISGGILAKQHHQVDVSRMIRRLSGVRQTVIELIECDDLSDAQQFGNR